MADQRSGAVRHDPELSHALLQVAKHHDTRKCLVLLGAILETPELVERLAEVLKPGLAAASASRPRSRKKPAGAKL